MSDKIYQLKLIYGARISSMNWNYQTNSGSDFHFFLLLSDEALSVITTWITHRFGNHVRIIFSGHMICSVIYGICRFRSFPIHCKWLIFLWISLFSILFFEFPINIPCVCHLIKLVVDIELNTHCHSSYRHFHTNWLININKVKQNEFSSGLMDIYILKIASSRALIRRSKAWTIPKWSANQHE